MATKNNQIHIAEPLKGLLIRTREKGKRSKSNDSSLILFDTNQNNGNFDIISENDSSFNNSDNENKLNFSRMDSCLSRLDSGIHRLDSKDSKDSNDNSYENDQTHNTSEKFFLSSNSEKSSFKLGYKQDKKNQNNKLSLFSSKSPFKLLNRNTNRKSSFLNKKENKFEDDNSKFVNNNISKNDKNNVSNFQNESKSNLNIIINYYDEEEEEEPEEKPSNIKTEKKEADNCPINFFEIKTKSKRVEQEDENEEEDEENDEENNDEEEEESEEKSSKDNTDNMIGDFDTKLYGTLIPKIVYINPLIRSKLDIEQASNMIKELLEQYDEKYNEIIEQTINAKKNI